MLLKYINKISGGNIDISAEIQILNKFFDKKNINFKINNDDIYFQINNDDIQNANNCIKIDELKKLVQEQSVILRDMYEFRKANKIFEEFSKINTIFRGINVYGMRVPNIIKVMEQYPKFKLNLEKDGIIFNTNGRIDELLNEIKEMDEIKTYNPQTQNMQQTQKFNITYTKILNLFKEQNKKYNTDAYNITQKLNTQYKIFTYSESLNKTHATEPLIIINILTSYKYLIINYYNEMKMGAFPTDGIDMDKLLDKINKDEIIKDTKIYEYVSNGKYSIILYTYFEMIFNDEIIKKQ